MAEIKNNIVDLEVVYSKLNATIDRNIDLLKEGATAVDAYNKKISVVPSEFQKSLTDIKTKTDAVAQSTKKLEQTEKQLQQARLKELQLAKQREQAFDKYERALEREQAKLQASESLYNKVQSKLNTLNAEYRDLAVRKELGLSLTAKEEQRYASLQNRIQTYDKTLKAVDATMGKHQRNVGNYAGSFNPLTNSMTQLTREMPAFTYSVQTGFMALSNNIPIFTDALQNAVAQNKELQKQGQPTTSVLKQVAGALFSFQTLLGVGITLLTVYGKEIGNWISGLSGASAILDELNDNQKKFNDLKKIGNKESIADRTELDKYVKTMRNRNLTDEERNIALQKLRNQFPFYLKSLTDEQLLNGNITKQLAEINRALANRASLERATEYNIKNKEKLVDLKIERDELIKIEKARLSDYEALKKIQGIDPSIVYRAFKLYNDVNKERIDIDKTILEYEKAIIKNNTTINYLKGQTIGLEYSETKAVQGTTKAKKEKNKVELEEIKSVRELIDLKDEEREDEIGSLNWLNKNIRAKRELADSLAKGTQAYEDALVQMKFYQDWLELIYGTQKKIKEQDFSAYFQSFVDSFGNQSGFSEVIKIMSGQVEGFGENAMVTALAISEAFQEAFNTINQASQANFDAEYARLEEQRDFAIEMAGGSATAREEIERQYEERKRAIQRREAEAQKRLAIFNIVTNTAQAILATYAKVGFPAGIPLAIAMGAIGAFQVGMVASQEIPQFWRGTENAPEGFAWTQEKGAEVITDKNGNVKTLGSDKGAQLTYLSKGDKVYKSHEDYINKVLSKNGISDLGSYMNFTPKMEIINNGITKEDLEQNFSKLASVIKNKDGVNISIDERGFRKKQGNTDFINSRLNLTSINV